MTNASASSSLTLVVSVEDYGDRYRAHVHQDKELLARTVRGSRREAVTSALEQAKEDVADELAHQAYMAERAVRFAMVAENEDRTEEDR